MDIDEDEDIHLSLVYYFAEYIDVQGHENHK